MTMETKPDTELIVAFASSADEAAFSALVHRHQQMVFRTCLRMLGNVQEAEDAVQATFIVLMNKAGTLKREGTLGGWLHAVARRIALEAIRQRRSQARSREAAACQTEDSAVRPADVEAVMRFIDEELDRLSKLQRQAVVLRHLEGHSEKEAAQLAGCPVGTLGRRASDGIGKLRQRLALRGVALSSAALAGVLTSEASAAVPETLLPSILTAVQSTATTGVATTTVSTKAMLLAKGALKIMFWNQVKVAALVVAGVAVVGGGSLTATMLAKPGEDAPAPTPLVEAPVPLANAPSKLAEGPKPTPRPSLTKLNLTVINRSPTGVIAVGFVDASVNPPRNYYLEVGESQDGFTVLAADMDKEQASINMNGVTIDLKMANGPVGSKADTDAALTKPAPKIEDTSMRADRMEKHADGTIMLDGNVCLTALGYTITADHMQVLTGDRNQIKRITANGTVVITNTDHRGTCYEAICDYATGEITMTGNPVWIRGSDRVRGDKITITSDQHVVAEGGGNVRRR